MRVYTPIDETSMRLKIEADRGGLKSPWDYRSALTAKIHEILTVSALEHYP